MGRVTFGFTKFVLSDGSTLPVEVVPPEVRGPENPFFEVEIDSQGFVYSTIAMKDTDGIKRTRIYRYRDDVGTSLLAVTDQMLSTYVLESATSMLGVGADKEGRTDGTLYRVDLETGISEAVLADSLIAGMNSILHRAPNGALFGLTSKGGEPNRLFRLDLETREVNELILDFSGYGFVAILSIPEPTALSMALIIVLLLSAKRPGKSSGSFSVAGRQSIFRAQEGASR